MAEDARCTKLLLLTVESLRADSLGAYSPGVETPALDALAAGALVFERAFATASSAAQSLTGILASNYPTTGGSGGAFGDRVSVADVLRAAGLATAAVHGRPFASAANGYGRGFDAFASQPAAEGGATVPSAPAQARASRRRGGLLGLGQTFARLVLGSPALPDEPHEAAAVTARRATEWLEGAPERFFLWVHLTDPHWPYGTRLASLPEGDRRYAVELWQKALGQPDRLEPEEGAELWELYGEEVRYLDRTLGEFTEGLREAGLWDGAVILLAGARGEAFREHGAGFRSDLLYDDLIHVPLMLRAPGLEPGLRPGLASLLDVAPTLCELAGAQPPECWEGRSLLGEPRREVFAETADISGASPEPSAVAVRTGDWKLIRSNEAGTEELYDVEADPRETRDRTMDEPKQLERLLGLLDEHGRRPRPGPAAV